MHEQIFVLCNIVKVGERRHQKRNTKHEETEKHNPKEGKDLVYVHFIKGVNEITSRPGCDFIIYLYWHILFCVSPSDCAKLGWHFHYLCI